MPSDRARKSYDAERMYRSVVSQQGRVTVEADTNEAEEIRTAQSRAEVIDIVGPTGTPDDGFKITLPAGTEAWDFAIGQGTFYVGGERLVSAASLTYKRQGGFEWVDFPHPDWAAHDAGPLWPDPRTPVTEFVYLAVTEQEVSAVEDPALREVALGGPDTAGRTRLIQRVHRAPMFGADCEEALGEVLKRTSPGLEFDHETMRLTSKATLQVDFVPVAGTVDKCQPAAQPGFLGAENQLIRVHAVDGKWLLWGYDNASFLYRAEIDSGDARLLVLKGVPVDAFHQPQKNQWVEVLRSAVTLDGDADLANAVGAPAQVLGYDAGTNVITLTAPLVLPNKQKTKLFARVWEGRIPFSGAGTTATELFDHEPKSIGVRLTTGGTLVPGDYWMIGVRPSTPDEILPKSLLQPRSPDGPNRWAAALGTIAWKTGLTADIHDCRRPFDNLVELTRAKCCEVKILKGDRAQKIVDQRLTWMKAHGITSLHLQFGAGVFEFDEPLMLTAPAGGGELSVSGCSSMLVAATQEVALMIRDWDSASVTDLSVSAAVAEPGKGKKGRPDPVTAAAGDEFRHIGGAITILNCKSSHVERVSAMCGTGDHRAASCLTVRNADNRPSDVRVRACEFSAGSRQVGVLLVNVRRAAVDDNRIGWNQPPKARIPPDALKKAIISDVDYHDLHGHRIAGWQVAGSYDVPQDFTLRYRTHLDLEAAWQTAFDALTRMPRPGNNENVPTNKWRKLQRVVSSILTQIVHRHRDGVVPASAVKPFHDWIDRMLKLEETVAAAGQAIVVGGARAADVRILHNTIDDAMDGIHVGHSQRGSRDTHLFADRVQVTGNTISLRVPWYDRHAHAGIFVGNATVVTVRDNQVHIQQPPAPWAGVIDAEKYTKATMKWQRQRNIAARPADGIRVWGLPGKMLLVTGNFSENASVGIHVVQGRNPDAEGVFLVTQNTALNARRPIHVTRDVIAADDNVPRP
jgi:hypothetical protein